MLLRKERWPPQPASLKKMVMIVADELPSGSVHDVFHGVRRRCPDWYITPHRIRKVLQSLRDSEQKGRKLELTGARSSGDSAPQVFPHDVVELLPHARKPRHAAAQWRGQISRVAGYDDGEVEDEEEQELPPGFCSVYWLSEGLDNAQTLLTKDSSVRTIDRPWVLGDRVARIGNPRSLGTVVSVHCKLVCQQQRGFHQSQASASAQHVRAVGGFRAEDWVACEESKWIGKVEEAVFRVEVELSGRSEGISSRKGGRRKSPACVFQVSSEGLAGLESFSSEDVAPQELSPYFPGQRVRAPVRLWRQAEWTRGGPGRCCKGHRGGILAGVVTSVKCELLAIRWSATALKDSQQPDEWVSPECVRLICLPSSSESWALGDHVQVSAEPDSPVNVIVESRTTVDVQWADGSVEAGMASTQLCPRPHISAHDFLPLDFVARSSDSFGDMPSLPVGTAETQQEATNPLLVDNYVDNLDFIMMYSQDDADEDVVMYDAASVQNDEILPLAESVDPPLGVVASVNLLARTAEVIWSADGDPEEVSVFELTPHPQIDVRLADAVIVPDAQEPGAWAGRVCEVRENGFANVHLLHGGSAWIAASRLLVADDGEGPDDGIASEESSSVRTARSGSESAEELPETWAQQLVEEELPAVKPGEIRERPCEPCPQEETQLAQPHERCTVNQSSNQDGGSSPSQATEVLAFDVFDEDIEPSEHFFGRQPAAMSSKMMMMAARREMAALRKGLLEGSEGVPAAIVVRSFSSRSDLFRAMVVGPPDTPYSHVPFFFDLALSESYPREPPLVRFHAQYGGSERLNPNLYADGKVCLSILGTWPGPSWDPQRSTLLQVVVSIQGLVLVEQPYFNEPGHECDAGTEHGQEASTLYNENARLLALRMALNVAQRPPRGFEDIVAAHFARHGPDLVRHCEEALRDPSSCCSEGFRKVLAKSILPRLRECWPLPETVPESTDTT